ncbi:methyltransferase [Streptomyces sp. ST2-7A]|uniref:methyltransferase n=1 Tax=Streptomyces sp. ST2-7A TaxID=2907214 RepID=UPI001F163DA7|nr:methyltransferase [Streptomyces sp. ST2-7A]
MANLGTPMAIRVAATLRIADHISAGVTDVARLARIVGADHNALDRLLRHLAVRGVLTGDTATGYALTPLGEALRDDHPAGIRSWFDIGTGGRGELSFVELLHSVRTGEAAFPVRYGRPFWEDLAADPERAEVFHRLLGHDVARRASEVLAAFDWSRARHVVDVGGGDGSLLCALLTSHPHLRGTVVDQEEAVAEARRGLHQTGLGDRADTVAGSFFDPLPGGADVYLLSLVLHDWNDDAAVAILRRCAEAAGRTGSILVIESVSGADDIRHTGMDLRMLCVYGARERDAKEFSALAERAGLRVDAVRLARESAIFELTTD